MANSQGYTVSQSMWALDAVEDFTTAPIYTSAEATLGAGAAGELQNDYSQCFGSSVFSSSYGLNCNADNVSPVAGVGASGPLYYGARLYNQLASAVTPPRAKTFAEYAVGNSASYGTPNAWTVSAWVYPTPMPDPTMNGLYEWKRYHIVSFASADHTTPAGATQGTCSLSLFLTGNAVDATTQYIGAETTISTSYGYVTDVVSTQLLFPLIGRQTLPSEWNHILCCYDATTPDISSETTDRFKIYLNGTLVSLTSHSVNYIDEESPFYGEIHPSTGAIGNRASQNLDLSTLTGTSLPQVFPQREHFLNNAFDGAIAEVSIFNYSLHSYNTSIVSEMYNDACPPDMSKMPVFNDIAQRPFGWYRMGATQPPPDIYGPPVPLATSSGQIGPGDTEGSASWNPDTAGAGSRLVNAVATFWPDDKNYYVDGLYAQGDGYPTLDVSLSAPADINMDFSDFIPPCSAGYDAADKNTLIASPIYNRKHSLGSVFSVAHFGWSVPKKYYPSSEDYQDRTLTMPIPQDSASIATWTNQYPVSPLISAAGLYTLRNPLGAIQTCGGSAEWEADRLAGYVKNGSWVSASIQPSHNTYDDYNVKMKLANQEYSIIPEFIISDQVDFYINSQRGNLLAPNYSQFAIKGTSTGSSGIPTNSSENGFFEIFSNSDFFKNFYVIKEDLKNIAAPSTITLKCKVLMKFLPYDGFFPSERSLQMANQFSKSYGAFVEYSGLDKNLTNARFRPFLTPFFRPGIVYNTIKSGLAVDFPIYTSSYQVINYKTYDATDTGGDEYFSNYYALGTQDAYSTATSISTASWDLRIPFEAAVEPEKYISNVPIYDLEPNPSSSLNIQARWSGEGDILYKRMMHNYLAAIPEFFLPNGEFTSLKSKPESEFLTVQSGTSYGMRVKLRRSMNKTRMWRSYANNSSVVTYELPQDPRNLTGDAAGLRETFTMYSRPSAFGPPVAGTTYLGFRQSIQPNDDRNAFYNTDLFPSDSLMGINPSYTPPYYGRESWADIVYLATTSGPVTVDEIFSNATVNLWGIDTNPILNGVTSSVTGSLYGNNRAQAVWSTNENPAKLDYSSPMRVSYANAYAMQLDASFNLLGKVDDRWVIEPKMETPHYNFNPETSIRPLLSASDTLTIPTNGSESCAVGMWHQFGTIESDKGIYIEIDAIPEDWRTTRGYADPNRTEPSGLAFNTELISGIDLSVYQNNKFRDLSKLVGFEAKKKLGNTAESLTVYEAVVAVPFTIKNGERQFFGIPQDTIRKALGDLNTISSDKSISQASLAVKAALQAVDGNKSLLGGLSDTKAAKVRAAAAAAAAGASKQIEIDDAEANSVSENIKDMVSKMKKYVFPPKMDFVANLGKVTPFAMYIFEFSKTFDQNDLSYMWQNLSPPSSANFSHQEASISHKLFANELMGSFGDGDNDPIKPGLQWMVFKVKQRANNNYFSKISKESGPKAEQFPVSYNWPYDFFSLVEFANIDTKIGFGKGLQDGGVDQEVAEIRENPLKVATKGAPTIRDNKPGKNKIK